VTLLILGAAALLLSARLLGPVARHDARPSEIRGHLIVMEWLNVLYCQALHRLVVQSEAPLPEHGPAILVSNHTSGVDNMVLQAGCRRVLGFMVAKEWYDAPIVGTLCRILKCIPVRRDGRDVGATRDALRALEDGRVLPIFPEGRINPDSGRTFLEGKPGAAFLTLRARVPVIPAYIRGTPPTRIVTTAIFSPSNARVIFGPPIDLSDLLTDEPEDREAEKSRLAAITDRLMEAIKSLRERSLALEGGP
jgi:1-acyl-sn-glycerol-3-phosphate acyltransferase